LSANLILSGVITTSSHSLLANTAGREEELRKIVSLRAGTFSFQVPFMVLPPPVTTQVPSALKLNSQPE